MSAYINFNAKLTSKMGQQQQSIKIQRVIIGGWTGRDAAAVQHHIDELAKIGVQAPEKTPMFYRVGISRVTNADTIEVIGDGSSGEVEYVLLRFEEQIWVGAGSDHTDRVFEHMGITIAKQLCDKPLATEFWPLDEVEAHWDQIKMRSYIWEDGKEILYQDGALANLLSPQELLASLRAEGDDFSEGDLLFGGTCGAIDDVRYSPTFRLELIDPVLDRKIDHSYKISPVPIKG